MLRRLDGRLQRRIALAFALSLAGWYALRWPYTVTLLARAEPVLARFLEEVPAGKLYKLEDGTAVFNTGLASPRAEGNFLTVRNGGLQLATWPLLLLFTLLLLTPRARLARLWRRALLAVLLLWCAQLATLVVEVLDQVEHLRRQHGRPLFSDGSFEALVLAGQYLKAVAPALPLAAYLPMLLSQATTERAARAVEPAERNAPCPCGSGRKFKRCCAVREPTAGLGRPG